jgi:hypothetical protein
MQPQYTETQLTEMIKTLLELEKNHTPSENHNKCRQYLPTGPLDVICKENGDLLIEGCGGYDILRGLSVVQVTRVLNPKSDIDRDFQESCVILDDKGDVYRLQRNYSREFLASNIVHISGSTCSEILIMVDNQGAVWYIETDEQRIHIAKPLPAVKLEIPGKIIRSSVGSCAILYLTDKGQVYSQEIIKRRDGVILSLTLSTPKLLPIARIVDIACGREFMLLLDVNGFVYASGNNNKGQLGLGHLHNQSTIVCIPSLKNIVKVYAFRDSSLCIDNNGKVFVFGENWKRELGVEYDTRTLDNDKINILPTQINLLNNEFIVQAALTGIDARFVTMDGRVLKTRTGSEAKIITSKVNVFK